MSLNVSSTFTWNETIWSPTALGARAWYDASDSSTVSATGGLVDSVADKSGNSLTLGSSSTNRPVYTSAGLNGKNVFTFNGGQYLTAATLPPWIFLHDSTGSSIFAVWQPGTSSDPDSLYGLLGTQAGASSATGVSLFFDDRLSSSRNNRLGVLVSGGAQVVNLITSDDAATSNTSQVCEWNLNPSASPPVDRASIRVNGGSAYTGNSASGTPSSGNPSYLLQLGALGNNVFPLVGTIAEVVLFAGILSDSDRQKVEGYLAHKWGLDAGLPSDHPYKNYGPRP